MNIEILEFDGIEAIKTEMRQIGVEEMGINLMAPKYIFKIIKLKYVRNAAANILKQEMLSLGGEAAVNRDTVNCKIERTDVLLAGTLKIYQRLIQKLKIQVAELKQIGEVIEEELNSKFLNSKF